jgi:hypothetical protein
VEWKHPRGIRSLRRVLAAQRRVDAGDRPAIGVSRTDDVEIAASATRDGSEQWQEPNEAAHRSARYSMMAKASGLTFDDADPSFRVDLAARSCSFPLVTTQRPTHLDVPLPDDWAVKDSPDGPLTWLKGGDESLGMLQALVVVLEQDEAADAAATLHDAAASLGAGFGWGEPATVTEGHSAYGQFVLAVFPEGPSEDTRLWLLFAEGADAIVFTWLASSPEGPASREVASIVLGAHVTPGSLEEFIPVVLGGARANMEADGGIVPAVILFAEETYEVLPLTGSDEAFFDTFIEVIRDGAAKSKAHTVALAFEVTVTRADGRTGDGVRVYLEHPNARKELLLPVVEVDGTRTLGLAREIPPTSIGGLVGFFEAPNLEKLPPALPDGDPTEPRPSLDARADAELSPTSG